jgi:hypothetical protein
MDPQSMVVVTAHLVRLAAAHRLTLTTETIDIYLEDLIEFPAEQVLTAIDWARQNMNRFPMIADLRIHIEGSDEAHANQAWNALFKMLYTHPSSSFTIADLVFARTIQDSWRDWPGTRKFFAQSLDEIAIAAAVGVFDRYAGHDDSIGDSRADPGN